MSIQTDKIKHFQLMKREKENCHLSDLVPAFSRTRWVKSDFLSGKTSHLYDNYL